MNVSPTTKRNTNFTEGSWRVVWTVDKDGDACFDILKSDADADDYGRTVDASYSIIESAYPVLENDDESKANANLISAAPDLYQALDRILTEFAASLNSGKAVGYTAGSMQRALRAIRNAEMALAYASGQDWRDGEDES